MKKSLLALAALGAFAGSAAAQSSVTLFGIVDLAATWVETADVEKYLLATSGNATSRLGFRGVEDLGGGLRAGFWLEGETFADDGNASAGATAAFNFRRRSTVSLMGGFGEIRLGRDYTPTFWNWTVFDPFGTNGVGAATNLALGGDLQRALSGTTFGTLVRANNMVAYILPAGQFGPGLYGQIQAAAGEGANGNKYYGGRLGWAGGPFDVAGSYGLTDCLDTACNIDMTVWNVGGSWNFGFMKLSGFYGEMEAEGNNNKARRMNWYVGAVAPFGQWNFKASYGGTDGKNLLSNEDASQWAIGVDYNLSKRTALYATWSSINNDGGSSDGARFIVSGQSSGLTPGNNSSGGQIGVRHSF
jgi:predicted porin